MITESRYFIEVYFFFEVSRNFYKYETNIILNQDLGGRGMERIEKKKEKDRETERKEGGRGGETNGYYISLEQ
jgi:hypothetical protein